MFAQTATHADAPIAADFSFWNNAATTTASSVLSLDHTESLFFEGDDADFVYEVVEGVVASYSILSDGRRQIHGFFFPGDLLGLSPDGEYHANTCAIGKIRVRSIPRSKLMRTAMERPEVAAKLLECATSQLVGMQNHFVLLGRKCAKEKVASFLHALAVRYKQDGAQTVSFRLPMSRTEIADYLGLTIETVSRTITKLRIAGVIDLPHSSTVEVRNIKKLEAVAGNDIADF